MEINFLQVLFQAINFGVILFILNKFLYKPIQKVLEERQHRIVEGLKAAEHNLKAEHELVQAKEAVLAKARREATKLLKDARDEAKQNAEQIIKAARDKAKQEAASILESAQVSVLATQTKLRSELKDLVVATTRQLLSESLSTKEVAAITKNMLKKLG